LVCSRFGGKTQTSSRREGEWLKPAHVATWRLGIKLGVTRPLCQLQLLHDNAPVHKAKKVQIAIIGADFHRAKRRKRREKKNSS